MDKKLAEIGALWAEWKSALMEQRSAWFEQAALRAENRRMQIEREIAGYTRDNSTGRPHQIGRT